MANLSSSPPPRTLLIGVALVCFANLTLEVVLTRIFSTTMFYHFTFVSIALALLGMGVAGVYVYVKADRFPASQAGADLARYSRRFALTTLICLVYVLANPISVITGKLDPSSAGPPFTLQIFWQLVVYNAIAALPFFYAGMVVALGVTHYSKHIDRLYAYDLVGAAIAAVLAGVLLGLFGGPNLVIVVALIAMVASAMFEPPRRAGWVAIGAVALLLPLNLVKPLLEVPSVKGVVSGRVVFEEWNAFSRVTVEKMNDKQYDIRIDASAATGINHASTVATRNWRTDISAFAYLMFEGGPEKVLIIGPGGGPDVANALAANTKQVIGVEVNPLIAEKVMKDRFVKENGGLYLDPRVRVVTDEGRSFIRRSGERYDVIQATLVDTWAATAAGAFALSENTLYTLEAFQDYFAHLTDDGVVTMTRWYTGSDPESQRLLVLAAGALEKNGVAVGETRKHIYFVRRGGRATLVAKRTPFTAEQIARLDAACVAPCEPVVTPTQSKNPAFARLVDAGAWSDTVRNEKLDVTPPTDDRPFFFYFLKPGDVWNVESHLSGSVRVGNPAVWILLAFGLTLTGLTVAFILLPLVYHRAGLLLGGGQGGPLRRIVALVYFALIGVAFITVEIALLQRFGFFLGHPAYALLVVLFAILLATAGGARLTGFVPESKRAELILGVGLLLALMSVFYVLVISDALGDWVAWSTGTRVVVAGVLTALPGLFMGMMLPSGVKLVSSLDDELVPWAWGINGALSVIGTVGATILAIHHGFGFALLTGGVFYALAGVTGWVLGRLVRRGETA